MPVNVTLEMICFSFKKSGSNATEIDCEVIVTLKSLRLSSIKAVLS